MAVVEETGEPSQKRKSKLPLIVGLVLALAGGGGGFYAVQSGLLGGGSEVAMPEQKMPALSGPSLDVAFVELPPMILSVEGAGGARHLRFAAQLETDPNHAADVEKIVPRIVDVLHTYLGAVNVADLADRRALPRLRSQMLRRVQIVTGTGRVRDLLIMELVVN